MSNGWDTFGELRKKIDGNDPFMSSGHQIKKTVSRHRKIPDWVKSNAEVRKLLLRSFPKLATDTKQREKAARWTRVIHLYFKMSMTHGQIAEELGEQMDDGTVKPLSLSTVQSIIRSITRVSQGRRADGRGNLVPQKGRPKKHATIRTTTGGRNTLTLTP